MYYLFTYAYNININYIFINNCSCLPLTKFILEENPKNKDADIVSICGITSKDEGLLGNLSFKALSEGPFFNKGFYYKVKVYWSTLYCDSIRTNIPFQKEDVYIYYDDKFSFNYLENYFKSHSIYSKNHAHSMIFSGDKFDQFLIEFIPCIPSSNISDVNKFANNGLVIV